VVTGYEEKPREQWILTIPLKSFWLEHRFADDRGERRTFKKDENALKDYYKKQVSLAHYQVLIHGELTSTTAK
jgi:hypothetical protein